ncbi:hypothetical protein, partial [Dubosiella newyorkensis]
MSESKQNSNTYSSFAEVRLPDPGPRKQTGSDRPAIVIQSSKGKWYYVKFEDNLNFCFLTNPKKFVPLSIDYGSLS